MIDLHCHLLPGLDDGPETIEESLEMCRIAHEDGIRIIVATPHFRPGRYECCGADVAVKVGALIEALKEHGIGITVLTGADVVISPELPVYLSSKPFLTINGMGRYFLAEMPHEAVPPRWEQFLLSWVSRGTIPILTHPERNVWFLNHPEALVSFVEGGGLVQLTAMSLTGENGAESQRYCRMLLERNLAHILATDAHSADRRPPVLSRALHSAAEIIGRERALDMTTTVPASIISGRRIAAPAPMPQWQLKRPWFRKLLFS